MDFNSKQLPSASCHGRVQDEDFEIMVPDQWWKTVFADVLYLKTDGDVVEDAEITKEEIRMLESNAQILNIFEQGKESAAVEDAPKVLDLCCGQGRHTLLLAERYPHLRLYGHDQSAYLIQLARERATLLPQAPHRENIPVFTVGDCRSVPYDNSDFDFVMIMGNSFGYFSANDVFEDVYAESPDRSRSSPVSDGVVDEGDRAVLREINRVMKTGGHMVLDLADGDYMRENFSPRSWEWIDDQTFVCRERVLSKDQKRLHSREVVVVVARGVVRDQFYSERLYGRAELTALLQEAGFEIESGKTVIEEGVNTVTAARELSQRGQDLGMMEQRLLIYASKVRDHPRANLMQRVRRNVNRSLQVPHPQMSAENAQAVREWIERLSLQDFSAAGSELDIQHKEYTKAVIDWIESCASASSDSKSSHLDSETTHSSSKAPIMPIRPAEQSSTNNVLREWIDRVILPPSSHIEPPSPIQQQTNANTITIATPSLYHLLPPPPFPNHQINVMLGDTSMPCRDKLNGQWNNEDLVTRQKLVDALVECGYNPSQINLIENHRDLVARLAGRPPNFVLNLCDEGFYNDAHKELHVPAFLEMCGVAYSGAGPVSLGVCYDKGFVNATAEKLGIHVPKETYIILPESVDQKDIRLLDIERMTEAREVSGDISYPAFVKPMKGDNSLGITSQSICNNRRELAKYILSLVNEYGLKQFIIQEYLTGTEYSVGVIGNPETGFHFLPILQVDYSKVVSEGLEPILGWESKWDPSSPYWTEVDFYPAKRIPSNKKPSSSVSTDAMHSKTSSPTKTGSRLFQSGGLTLEEEEDLKRSCTILFERFGCRDYARFDWRADKEIVYDVDTGEIRQKTLFVPVSQDEVISDSGRGSIDSIREESNGGRHRRLKLLEVNPNPGWCWDGKLAKMAAFEGIAYHDVIKCILWASWERSYGHSKGEGRQLLAEWCASAIRGQKVEVTIKQ